MRLFDLTRKSADRVARRFSGVAGLRERDLSDIGLKTRPALDLNFHAPVELSNDRV